MKQPPHTPDEPVRRRQKPYRILRQLFGKKVSRRAALKTARIMGDTDD